MKPFSQACQNNRAPILKVLERVFEGASHALEIGSGTGQHAVFFAKHLPHLTWQTSDLVENHSGINQWIEAFPVDNILAPLNLDVANADWSGLQFDALFSANTLHIMSWAEVQKLFHGLAAILKPGAVVSIYGPFNYHGKFTSDSNERFDRWLKAQNPERGIRDFAAVDGLAQQAGLALQEDNTMPANNRLLVWVKDR